MCDVKKIQICEIMELVNIFRKNKMRRAPLAKNHPVSANLWVDISTGLLWWLDTNPSGLDRNVNDAGLFLEPRENFSDPKANFEIKTSS